MIKSSLISLNIASKKVEKDPFKRLSLAVRELDKLINRANQLAHLSDQPFPPYQPIQPDQTIPPLQSRQELSTSSKILTLPSTKNIPRK